MLDIYIGEEISSKPKKKSLYSVGRKASRRENCEHERTFLDSRVELDDRVEKNIDINTRDQESTHRDTLTNVRQSIDLSKKDDNDESELEGYEVQEHEQSFRSKTMYTSDDSSKSQENRDTCHDSEANKESDDMKSKVDTVIVEIGSIRLSQRIIDLYEFGKHRVISNRENAAANSLAIDNLAANVAALSNTKASASEIAGQRLFIQAKLSAERLDKLRQIARDTPLPQMDLATQQRSDTVLTDWKKYREMKNNRIAALYELGKNRVITNRELAISKAKVETVVIDIRSIRLSQRIDDLYELGKHRIMIDRKLAAENLLPIDNLEEKVISISGKKPSPSEIAGQRLFIQAELSAERIAKLRQKANETPLPQMELEAKKRQYMICSKWGTSAIERFSMLYEKGKRQIVAERKLVISALDERVNVDEKVDAGYASTRQVELYMMGTRRIIKERSDEEQYREATEFSPKSQTKIEANATMIKLYEMSKKEQDSSKQLSQGIMYGEDDMILSTVQSNISLNEISPNATMSKLYAMSEIMREDGKQRRDKIANERLNFPVIKV